MILRKKTLITLWLLSVAVLNYQVIWGFNIYWANLHSHTLLSDGQGLPSEAYLYARDTARIDILAITDHTHYLSQANYQYIKTIAQQFTEPGRFLALCGQEFGSLGAFGHFSIFEAESLYQYSVNNLAQFYQWIYDQKILAQFNHPRNSDFNYLAYNQMGDEYTTMFEVVNGSGLYTTYNEELYIKALNQGWHVAPVANQDNHNRRWGNATTIDGKIPLTGVWAKSLTKNEVLNAMRQRRLYAAEVKPASDRIFLWDFSVDEGKMGDIYYTDNTEHVIRVKVSAVNKFSRIYLYRNGVIRDSCVVDTNYLELVFNDTLTNGYYFIKGLQQDNDRFWSAPIWISHRPMIAEIEIRPHPIRSCSKIIVPQLNINSAIKELKVFTAEGRLVYKDIKNYSEELLWNGCDNSGNALENGIYYLVVKIRNESVSYIFKTKAVLLRGE
ncbi:MAG: CehA/McbA family metallohydrolase [candidate division WOR-3 bacterium]|nr:CehA/McbA family metallohydrolase [candidate division WOR-3 bacterium]